MGFQTTTHKVSVFRLVETAGQEEYGADPVYTGLDVGIFPASADILAVYPGEASYQLYEIFVYEPAVIKNGDKLVSGSDEWIVRGAPQVFDFPQISYQRLVGEKVV
jgi:hypothetical protein